MDYIGKIIKEVMSLTNKDILCLGNVQSSKVGMLMLFFQSSEKSVKSPLKSPVKSPTEDENVVECWCCWFCCFCKQLVLSLTHLVSPNTEKLSPLSLKISRSTLDRNCISWQWKHTCFAIKLGLTLISVVYGELYC